MGAVALLFTSVCALAQSTALTLVDAVDLATQLDVQTRTMQSQLLSAQEKVTQAKARFHPQLQYSRFGTNTQRNDLDSEFRNRDYENRQWALELQLPIYRRENLLLLRQAQLELDLAQQRLELARNEILTKATKAYLDVLKAARQWEFAGLQLGHAQQRLQYFRIQHERGLLSELELLDVQAKQLHAQAQRVQAANDLTGKRLELQRLLGVSTIETLMSLSASTSLGAVVNSSTAQWQTCLKDSGQEHPSVVMGRLGLLLNQNELARAKAEFIPTLDLTMARNGINQTGNTYSAFPSRYKENAITLKLTVPIYNGGSSASKIRESQALSGKAIATLDAAVQQLGTSRAQALNTLSSLSIIDEAFSLAHRSAQLSLAQLEMAVHGGVKSVLDVIPAREEHRRRLLEHELARYDALNEWAKLLGICHSIGVQKVRQLSDQMSEPLDVAPLGHPSEFLLKLSYFLRASYQGPDR